MYPHAGVCRQMHRRADAVIREEGWMDVFKLRRICGFRPEDRGRLSHPVRGIPAVMIFIVFLVFFFILLMLVLPWISVAALLRRKTHHANHLKESGLNLSKAREIFDRVFSGPAVLPEGSPDGNGERKALTVAPEGEKRAEWTAA